MHAIFIPYGARPRVEKFLRHIEAHAFKFPMKKGKQKSHIILYGAVRQLPFGAYEAIFPREYKDEVLTSLNFHLKAPYINSSIVKTLRLLFKAKSPRKFDSKKWFPWDKADVSIIPIGIREDGDLVEPAGKAKGWEHEAI